MKKSFKIVALLGAFVFVGFSCPTEAEIESQIEDEIKDQVEEAVTDAVDEALGGDEEGETVTVEYTDDGFDPATLSVTVGTTVVWENNSGRSMDVSSDPHPIHTSNRDLNASTPTAPGDSYSFTFTEVGNQGYHNHLRSSHDGSVIVE